MRHIYDLRLDEVVPGLRLRSLTDPAKIGTVVSVDPNDDYWALVQWDGEDRPTAGFYAPNCACEVVEDHPNVG